MLVVSVLVVSLHLRYCLVNYATCRFNRRHDNDLNKPPEEFVNTYFVNKQAGSKNLNISHFGFSVNLYILS